MKNPNEYKGGIPPEECAKGLVRRVKPQPGVVAKESV